MEHFPISSAFLGLTEPEIRKFKTSRREIFKGFTQMSTRLFITICWQNWISTTASIDPQLRHSFSTTLFYVSKFTMFESSTCKGLFTWREGAQAKWATQLTELLG